MYGAILGDIIGSPFEFDRGNKTKNIELFSPALASPWKSSTITRKASKVPKPQPQQLSLLALATQKLKSEITFPRISVTI